MNQPTSRPMNRKLIRVAGQTPYYMLNLVCWAGILLGVASVFIILPLSVMMLAVPSSFQGEDPAFVAVIGMTFLLFGTLGALGLLPSIAGLAWSMRRSWSNAIAIQEDYIRDVVADAG